MTIHRAIWWGPLAALTLGTASPSGAVNSEVQRLFGGKPYHAAIGGGLGFPGGWPCVEYEMEQVFSKMDSLGVRAELWSPTGSYDVGGVSAFGVGAGASSRWYPFKTPVGINGGPFRGLAMGGGLDLMLASVSYRYNAPCGNPYYGSCPYESSSLWTLTHLFSEVGWKFVLPNQKWMAYVFIRVGLLLQFGHLTGYKDRFGGPGAFLGVNFYYLLR